MTPTPTRLSVRLAQIAVLGVLVAVATALGLISVADGIEMAQFEALLTPAQLIEWRGNGPLSPALARLIESDYAARSRIAVTLIPVLVGLLMGGLVGMESARALLRPFARLADAATRIARGDFSARVGQPALIVKIDRFTRVIDSMAETIERAELERRESSAAIAHELRTPLTVLSGRLNGMLDGVFPMDRAGVSALLAQTGLLARIVDDLRLLTLAETQHLGLDLADCDLADQARIVAAAQPPGVTVTLDLSPAPVRCDPMRLRQALQALLTNAARYGGTNITIATGTDARGRFLSVLDRGPGLTPDQAAAFDRFWRADRSRARDTGGSGPGCRSCKPSPAPPGPARNTATARAAGPSFQLFFRWGRGRPGIGAPNPRGGVGPTLCLTPPPRRSLPQAAHLPAPAQYSTRANDPRSARKSGPAGKASPLSRRCPGRPRRPAPDRRPG